MSDDQPGLDPDFAKRMRSGLASMAVRERRRERARNRAIGIGLATTAVVGVIAVAFGQLGVLQPGSDEAVPTVTPSVSPTPSAAPTETPDPTPTPEPTPSAEPTPPPGFEGVAAGQPVHVGTFEDNAPGNGDAAGPGLEPIDVYALCMGSGQIYEDSLGEIDCTQLPPGTIVSTHDMDDPNTVDVVATDDFNGVLTWVPAGEQPVAESQGGTATVTVQCWATNEYSTPEIYVVGGVTFDCATVEVPADSYVELAAWGVPYDAGQFGPPISEASAHFGGITMQLEGPF